MVPPSAGGRDRQRALRNRAARRSGSRLYGRLRRQRRGGGQRAVGRRQHRAGEGADELLPAVRHGRRRPRDDRRAAHRGESLAGRLSGADHHHHRRHGHSRHQRRRPGAARDRTSTCRRTPPSVPTVICTSSTGTTTASAASSTAMSRPSPAPASSATPGRRRRSTSQFNHPTNVCFDAAGDMIVAAWHNSLVKRLDFKPDGSPDTAITIAGTGARAFGGDDGPGIEARLDLPSSVVVDSNGNVIISDQANYRLRLLEPNGTIHTICGTGTPGAAGDGGPADDGADQRSQGPVGAAGEPHRHRQPQPHLHRRYRQPQDPHDRRDGHDPHHRRHRRARFQRRRRPGRSTPQLNTPSDVAVAPNGTLYIADTDNNVIRYVKPNGTIETVAGTGERGFSGDGGAGRGGRARSALRCQPRAERHGLHRRHAQPAHPPRCRRPPAAAADPAARRRRPRSFRAPTSSAASARTPATASTASTATARTACTRRYTGRSTSSSCPTAGASSWTGTTTACARFWPTRPSPRSWAPTSSATVRRT